MSKIIHTLNRSDNIIIYEYEKTNIYIIENILDIKICDALKKIIDTVKLLKTIHSPGNNVECNVTSIGDLLKLNDEMYYHFTTDQNEYRDILDNIKLKNSLYTNKLNGLKIESIHAMNEIINNILIKIKELMKTINPRISFNQHTGYLLRKVYGETRLHIDNISEVYDSTINFIKENKKGDHLFIRNASLIFALNDDYDGGIFNFPYYDISVKLKKGSVIIFPPYWTHEHSVSSVENNTFRYTLSTWACSKV